jgi:hypothetical protein
MLLERLISLALTVGLFAGASRAQGAAGPPKERVALILGTACLTDADFSLMEKRGWRFLNRTCLRYGGRKEQFKILEPLPPAETPDAIFYIEGPRAEVFLDYLRVNHDSVLEDHPFPALQLLWKAAWKFWTKGNSLEVDLAQAAIRDAELLRDYCRPLGCQTWFFLPSIKVSTSFLFSRLCESRPWLAGIYTLLTPRISLELARWTMRERKSTALIFYYSPFSGAPPDVTAQPEYALLRDEIETLLPD